MTYTASDEKTRIAIVGAGRMGANIARHLKDAGYPITAIHDARPEIACRLEVLSRYASPPWRTRKTWFVRASKS